MPSNNNGSGSDAPVRKRELRWLIRILSAGTALPVIANMFSSHTMRSGLFVSSAVLIFLSAQSGRIGLGAIGGSQFSFRSLCSSLADTGLSIVVGSAFLVEAIADGLGIPIISPVLHAVGYALELVFLCALATFTYTGASTEKEL